MFRGHPNARERAAPLLRPPARPLGPLGRLRVAVQRQRGAVDRRRIFALALAAMTFVLLRVGSGSAASEGASVRVQVATRPLPAGEVIGETDLRWAEWPASLVPAASLPFDARGATVRERLLPGEVVVAARLFGAASLGNGIAGSDTAGGAVAALEPRERAVHIPLPIGRSSVAVGSRVQLVGLLPTEEPWGPTPTHLANGVVLEASQDGAIVVVAAGAELEIVRHVVLGTVELIGLP